MLYLIILLLALIHLAVFIYWQSEVRNKKKQLHLIKNRVTEIQSNLPTSSGHDQSPLGAEPSVHDFDLRSANLITERLSGPEKAEMRESVIRLLGEEHGNSTFSVVKVNARQGMSERIIEAYPMAGIIGTLVSIGSATMIGTGGAEEVGLAASNIMESFSTALGTTLLGLAFAIVAGVFVSPYMMRRTEELAYIASRADSWASALSDKLATQSGTRES